MSNYEHKFNGLAKLFNGEQIRVYFIQYVLFLASLEFLIFFIAFLGNLGPDKGPFPWKFYFTVAFTIPLVTTFLLAIFVIAFNQFLFGENSLSFQGLSEDENGDGKRKFTLNLQYLTANLRKIPLLLFLFSLIVGAIILYNLDSIINYITSAGEKFLYILFISIGVILFICSVVFIIWLVISYKLRKFQMENEYRYKHEVMEKLGFVIMENNAVIDNHGKQITTYDRSVPEIEYTDPEKPRLLHVQKLGNPFSEK